MVFWKWAIKKWAIAVVVELFRFFSWTLFVFGVL